MDVANPDTTDRELVGELLEICEYFFAHAAGPVTLNELDATLRARGNNGGSGWLIDMLGLTRMGLERDTTNTD